MIDNLIVSFKSNKDIDTVKTDLETIVSDFKFSILSQFPFQEMMDSKGFPIEKKIYVFNVCQAKFASKVLTEATYFSAYMPCRVNIYEENNQTIIATQDMTAIISTLEDDELKKEATELFNRLKEMLEKIK